VRAWDAAITPQAARALGDELAARGLTYGGRPFFSVARPRFLSASGIAQLGAVSVLVMSALARAERMVLEDRSLLEEVGTFTPFEQELLEITPRLRRANVSVRLDASFSGGRVRFFELNGAVPGGVELIHESAEAFAATPMHAEVLRTMGLRRFDLRGQVVRSLRAAWTSSGGIGDPVVAVVDWAGEGLQTEFEILAAWLEAEGIEAFIADPRDLDLADGVLSHRGRRIDLVYRRLTTADMVARPDECRTLVQAAAAGAVAVLDPIRNSLLDRKAIFALLTDPARDLGLSPPARAAVRRSVPWTRLVREGTATAPDGGRVDLLAHLRSGREHLVLKPNHDYGGRGVHLGWELSADEWDRALDEALEGEWVAQEAVPLPPPVAYPGLEDPAERRDYHESTDPYLFLGELGGVLTRLSAGGVANVTSGATATPAFIVDD
jgi:uncharacterized circularly permuted ATP-grasp superfamily protein